MSDFPQVQILLATYNGAKFLEEQLDSILGQTYPNWEILARDDGSKDDTPAILKGYQTTYPDRIKIVADGEGNLGGYTQNFHRLAQLSTAPVIAFSDQDDVWNENKVDRSVKAVLDMEQRHGVDKPALVHHDFVLVDANKETLQPSFDKAHGCKKSTRVPNRMPFHAEVHGFSMTINRALMDVSLPLPQIANGHDSVIACLANDIGQIEFIPDQLALYRRHGNNASQGMSLVRRSLNKLLFETNISNLGVQLKSIFQDAHNNLAQKCEMTKSYLGAYGNVLPSERRAILEKFSELASLNPVERKMVICQYGGLSVRSQIIAGLML